MTLERVVLFLFFSKHVASLSLECVRCAAKANFYSVSTCALSSLNDTVLVVGQESQPVGWYHGHLDTYQPPVVTNIENSRVATCNLYKSLSFQRAGSFDVVLASAPRKGQPPYLKQVISAYTGMLKGNQRIFVGWDDSRRHDILLEVMSDTNASKATTFMPIGKVDDPVPDAPLLTSNNFNFGTEARARIQTETLLRTLESAYFESRASLFLITEDDFLPCAGFVHDMLLDLAKIRNNFTSYRCAYGLGCLVIQRRDVVPFVSWARENVAVAPIDTLSSVFFAKESIRNKWVRHDELGGHVYFEKSRKNFVKQFVGTVHIGKQSTFNSTFHSTTLSQVKHVGCGSLLDTRSPVEENGVFVDKFNTSCSHAFCSPCDAVSILQVVR